MVRVWERLARQTEGMPAISIREGMAALSVHVRARDGSGGMHK